MLMICSFSSSGPVNQGGCSIDDLVPCNGVYPNHGQYMKNLVSTAKEFVSDGVITETEKEAIVLEGSDSNCGK